MPWETFWAAFPSGLAQLPGLGAADLAGKLAAQLEGEPDRAAFVRAVAAANNAAPLPGEGAAAAAALLTVRGVQYNPGGSSLSAAGWRCRADALVTTCGGRRESSRQGRAVVI